VTGAASAPLRFEPREPDAPPPAAPGSRSARKEGHDPSPNGTVAF